MSARAHLAASGAKPTMTARMKRAAIMAPGCSAPISKLGHPNLCGSREGKNVLVAQHQINKCVDVFWFFFFSPPLPIGVHPQHMSMLLSLVNAHIEPLAPPPFSLAPSPFSLLFRQLLQMEEKKKVISLLPGV